MGFPVITVEIDFVHGPLTANASNTWTDVTAYVHSFTTRRGRSDALARIEAGTATLLLDNSDRRFDPTFATGPYYGNLLPMRKIRISAVWLAVTYRIFTGFIEGWPPEWPGGLDATTTIPCVDAFKGLNLTKLNGAYANEYVNQTINTWLNTIGWPAADRNLPSAQSQIQAGTFVNTPALQHFLSAGEVESGLVFIAGDGKITFQDRHWRLTNSLTSVATYTDATGGALPWYRTTKTFDDQNIWNEIRVTRTGGVEQVASDSASKAAYFTRTLPRNLPILTDAEALRLAQWLLAIYKDPLFRFTSVTLDGLSDDALWPHMLGRILSERVTIVETPPGGAGTITQECYIEGVAHTVTADDDGAKWRTTFQLSPAATGAANFFWVLNDPVLSILGSTTRLAY